MSQPLNAFPPLDEAIEAALRASIERFGVIVPVVVDQHDNILDGHHRSRIAEELGINCPKKVIPVEDEAHAREIARTLNTDRRHLTPDQRRPMVVALKQEGHSNVAIGQALGVSEKQVRKDVAAELRTSPNLKLPERTTGIDGKSRPARRVKKNIDRDYAAPVEATVERPDRRAPRRRSPRGTVLSRLRAAVKAVELIEPSELVVCSPKTAETAHELLQRLGGLIAQLHVPGQG